MTVRELRDILERIEELEDRKVIIIENMDEYIHPEVEIDKIDWEIGHLLSQEISADT